MKLPDLTLSLQFARFDGVEEHRAALPRAQVQKWVRHALAAGGAQAAQITVRIVDADEGLALNTQFRGRDYATNVLTFDYAVEPVVMADLVLCAPVLAREAAELRKPLREHYAHLVVHGVLHALGYDHETGEGDAEEMEALEISVLAALGYANPYEAS